MELSVMAQLALALTVVAAAIFGFNALIGRGPRGTLWIAALCPLTWGTMLPIVLRDPDGGALPPELDLAVTVLQLCGLIGALLGIVDLLLPRSDDARHPIAERAVRQPLLWGLAACANFYALLLGGAIESPLLLRYLAGHPVEIIEAAFFFVGLAILVSRFGDVQSQLRSLESVALRPERVGSETGRDCHYLLAQLGDLPHWVQESYLVRRLREALQFVQRKQSADELDQHLRHLEELDAVQMHSGYATLRIIIWAIPILGFLGTVIGITVAIANLSPSALEQSMTEVTQGLGVAFDTTAEALALTMVLMFGKSLVERVEDRLLSGVNARVSQELVGRFQRSESADDPNVATIRRMSEQVLEAVEALAARQADVWKQSIHETHQQWADVNIATGQIVKHSLSRAIQENLEQHARILAQNALKHADRLSTSAGQHVERLERGAQETVERLREGLEKLAELLVEALERHGEALTTTERELAQGSRQHLLAAIELLGERLAHQFAMASAPGGAAGEPEALAPGGAAGQTAREAA